MRFRMTGIHDAMKSKLFFYQIPFDTEQHKDVTIIYHQKLRNKILSSELRKEIDKCTPLSMH